MSTKDTPATFPKIPMGVSACLLGEQVRFDGGHKHDPYLTETLAPYFEFVPVCPEVGCGLSIPREAMHLEGEPESPRLVGIRSGTDYTEQMQRYCEKTVEELRSKNLHGFIFKSKSPSSGLFHVKLYTSDGNPKTQHTSGLFARAVTQAFPTLPCEEDGRLNDAVLRENFIERVFALKRFRDEVVANPSVAKLQNFHARSKYLLMAHSPEGVQELGPLVAGTRPENLTEHIATYEKGYLSTMATHATVGRHVNVLQHMQGYFSEHLTPAERAELGSVIEEYAREEVPLIVPMTLFRHFIALYKVSYLMQQHYLYPHPSELKLRNHA